MAARLTIPEARRPKCLIRLESALSWLDEAAEEGDAIRYEHGRAGRNEWPDPGAARRRWRRMRDKYLQRLNRLANDLEAELQGDQVYRINYGWRCPRCQRFRNRHASFCDNCGTPKPGDAP
jgi:hypothetical protein